MRLHSSSWPFNILLSLYRIDQHTLRTLIQSCSVYVKAKNPAMGKAPVRWKASLASSAYHLQDYEVVQSHIQLFQTSRGNIFSNQGSLFACQLRSYIMENFRVLMSLISGYHPQANSQVEKTNLEINHLLCMFCANKQRE